MSARPRSALVLLAGLAFSACCLGANTLPGSESLHAWEGSGDPAALDAWVHLHMRGADAAVAKLLAVKGARTVANTLRPYDDAVNQLDLATFQASVLYGVGATKELRDRAQQLTQTANAALTAMRPRATTSSARSSSTAWPGSTRTRRPASRSSRCRTRSPDAASPSSVPCTMTCAASW